jgi:hypothetical protein
MDFALIEPAIVPDVFISGLADAEDLGDGNWRWTFYARQKSIDYAGAVELVVVARIILPHSAVIQSIRKTMQSMGVSCCGAERLRLMH